MPRLRFCLDWLLTALVLMHGLGSSRLAAAPDRAGLFGEHDQEARADGHFVHVFVERASGRPTAMPERIRAALERLRT